MRSRLRRSFIGRLARSRIASFSIIGLGLTVFGLVFIRVAKELWGWDADLANAVQAIVSIVSNFLLNYYFTWSDQRFLRFQQSAGRFIGAKVVTFITNAILFALGEWVFIAIFGESWWIFTSDSFAYIFSTGVITVLNYPIMDTFVFGKGSVRGDLLALFVRLWGWVFLSFQIFKRKDK